MSDTLSIATNALNSSAARITKAASSIANASLTGGSGDLSTSLVTIAQEKINYAADAKVVKVVNATNKALLDILV